MGLMLGLRLVGHSSSRISMTTRARVSGGVKARSVTSIRIRLIGTICCGTRLLTELMRLRRTVLPYG